MTYVIDQWYGWLVIGFLVAATLSAFSLTATNAQLKAQLELERTIALNTGLVCSTHARSAVRQQIGGGAYKWKPYCDWRLRTECEMVFVQTWTDKQKGTT